MKLSLKAALKSLLAGICTLSVMLVFILPGFAQQVEDQHIDINFLSVETVNSLKSAQSLEEDNSIYNKPIEDIEMVHYVQWNFDRQ